MASTANGVRFDQVAEFYDAFTQSMQFNFDGIRPSGGSDRVEVCDRIERWPLLADQSGHPCLSGACFGWTDQAAGLSFLSASAAAAVACTLSGA